MAKNMIEEYDSTASDNQDVGGVAIKSNDLVSKGSPAFQEIMSHLADHFASATVASATTTDIGANAAQALIISGTTTITGFGTIKAGTIKFLTFSGILTLTHNGTSLILPGGANIVTAAGDTAVFMSLGSGNWRCLAYTRGSGRGVINVLGFRSAAATIASGAITATSSVMIVDTEGGASSDSLDTINGGAEGDFLILFATSALRIVTVGGGGNIGLTDSATLVGGGADCLILYRAASFWVEVARNSRSSRTLSMPSIIADKAVTPAVQFPATQVPDPDANTLDDYEEGTFNPTLTTSGVNFTSVTYDPVRSGRYTKIGNCVFFSITMQTDAVTIGSATGNVLIGGLPFTANADPFQSVSVSYSISWGADEPNGALVIGGSTTIGLYKKSASNGNSAAVAVADVGTSTNSNNVIIAGHYFV